MNRHKQLDPSKPIILGLAGEAGTGKTTTADCFSSGNSPRPTLHRVKTEVHWEHLFFALPLYRMASTRRDIRGQLARDRMKYEIHATLLEVFGANPVFGAPRYSDLIAMVEEIVSLPFDQDAEGKPRTFLQHVGTEICRAKDPNCWVNWMGRKIQEDYRYFVQQDKASHDRFEVEYDDYEPPLWGTIISDCRFVNEAEFVANDPNGVLIKLTARPEVLRARLRERDGAEMTKAQKGHASETQVAQIPNKLCNAVIDTSDMTVEEQADYVNDLVNSMIGI